MIQVLIMVIIIIKEIMIQALLNGEQIICTKQRVRLGSTILIMRMVLYQVLHLVLLKMQLLHIKRNITQRILLYPLLRDYREAIRQRIRYSIPMIIRIDSMLMRIIQLIKIILLGIEQILTVEVLQKIGKYQDR